MMEQNKDNAETIEDLFYVFAKEILTYMETWAETEGIPQQTLLRTHFSDITSTGSRK